MRVDVRVCVKYRAMRALCYRVVHVYRRIGRVVGVGLVRGALLCGCV